jgi:hypothetical protein
MLWVVIGLFGLANTFAAACLPLILKYMFGFETFIVKSRDMVENISARVSAEGYCATWTVTSKKMPSGLCALAVSKGGGGGLAFLWIGEQTSGDEGSNNSGGVAFRVICTSTTFGILGRTASSNEHGGDDADGGDETERFAMVERGGPWSWIGYTHASVTPWVPEPRDWQVGAVDNIVSMYQSRNQRNAVVLVTSEPGKGKSTIAFQVAKRLRARLCKSFNPTQPGDNLANLLREVRPNERSPLVIVFDEVDRMLFKVHKGLVAMHKNVDTQVMDKSGWSDLLDDITNQRRFVILIMLSNMNKTRLKELLDDDESYYRDGRVHLCIEQEATTHWNCCSVATAQ